MLYDIDIFPRYLTFKIHNIKYRNNYNNYNYNNNNNNNYNNNNKIYKNLYIEICKLIFYISFEFI